MPRTRTSTFARVKVPDVFPQWVQVPGAAADGRPGSQSFVRLLDVIRNNLEDLFPGMTIVDVMPFRVTATSRSSSTRKNRRKTWPPWSRKN